ncbi:hypothetical protein P167DRAFT_535840 [Morchella conica CCBAS932]|uniref:Uncharacterized protein n=1 Tax=Morchella conica CCBAS932 TaxID=1392247 RepID=A0A3N4KT68_9PEZI|nr:hypothetical protein P167DRAFT_535840 [Morchella conica CCBAS932]
MSNTSPKEPKFPDLSQIGLAFAQAITFINYQPCPDLDENARQWLLKAGTGMMANLKSELDKLKKNKNNHIDLPAWALNPEKELIIYSFQIPYILIVYKDQFETCLANLLEACGFDPKPLRCYGSVALKIRFREAGLRRPKEAHKPKELCSDMVFMKNFYDTMSKLRITQ